jgi:hypothetical protein
MLGYRGRFDTLGQARGDESVRLRIVNFFPEGVVVTRSY